MYEYSEPKSGTSSVFTHHKINLKSILMGMNYLYSLIDLILLYLRDQI